MLDGFPKVDFERVTAAFRTELTHLIKELGIPETWRKSWQEETIKLDAALLPRGAGPEAIGARLAQNLYERLRSPIDQPASPVG